MDIPVDLDGFQLIVGLVGGLALFLFGMEQMTDALKLVAGGGMKRLLARLTTNRFSAAFAGAFVTAIIQSSSVTTVFGGWVHLGWTDVTRPVCRGDHGRQYWHHDNGADHCF